jgi:hypothetical protein
MRVSCGFLAWMEWLVDQVVVRSLPTRRYRPTGRTAPSRSVPKSTPPSPSSAPACSPNRRPTRQQQLHQTDLPRPGVRHRHAGTGPLRTSTTAPDTFTTNPTTALAETQPPVTAAGRGGTRLGHGPATVPSPSPRPTFGTLTSTAARLGLAAATERYSRSSPSVTSVKGHPGRLTLAHKGPDAGRRVIKRGANCRRPEQR